MHVNFESMTPTVEFPGYVGRWEAVDGMHFSYEHCEAGSNIDNLLTIYPNNACPVPHWGYIFSGSVRVEFVDQPEEIYHAGDFFHVPPGHRPYMLEDTVLLQITEKTAFDGYMHDLAEAGLIPAP
jgi:hypothetical protein